MGLRKSIAVFKREKMMFSLVSTSEAIDLGKYKSHKRCTSIAKDVELTMKAGDLPRAKVNRNVPLPSKQNSGRR